MHPALGLLSSGGAGCTLPCSGAHLVIRWQNHYFMYVVTFFFIQSEGWKGRPVLKSISKVILYHETEGTRGVQVCRSPQLALVPAEWCGAEADGFGVASSYQRP